ncbi:MAG: DUF1887 family protein [Ruminococcaceae bacterium]|nr:DUF1887 family protein [Oscillospiraceae bacterium]
MTYVEFFSRNISENLCASLVDPPERVVLIGDKRKLLEEHAARYCALFETRGYTVEFICRSVNRNRLDSVVEALTAIVSTYSPCAFDLTGGDELYLVGLGIVFERFADRNLQLHRFNIRTGNLLDCDRDGEVIGEKRKPTMSVEEYIRVGGGRIVYAEEKPWATVRWTMTEDFQRDIHTIWKICRADVRRYNVQIGVFAAAERHRIPSEHPLTTEASVSDVLSELEEARYLYRVDTEIIGQLREAGLIGGVRIDDNRFAVTYKNEQVKRILTKAGLALEMKLYVLARAMTDDLGEPFFQDVRNGVFIDWDGEVHEGEGAFDTENEVDLVLMRGVVPCFLSCKNGTVTNDELYKLSAVTEKFGGVYAKKMLAASAIRTDTQTGYHLAQRCADMGIWFLNDLASLSDEEIIAAMREFFLR